MGTEVRAKHLGASPLVVHWCEAFLASREKLRYRDVRKDRNVLATHVMCDELALRTVRSLTVSDGREWLARMLGKRVKTPKHVKTPREDKALDSQTVIHALNLFRKALQYAFDEGIIDKVFDVGSSSRSRGATSCSMTWSRS